MDISAGAGRTPVLAVSPYGIDGASSRVRVHGWFEHTGVPAEYHGYLGTSNNQMGTVLRRLPRAAAAEAGLRRLSRRVRDRTVFLSREATPFSSGGIESALLRNARLGVYDFDDALYADDASALSRIWSKNKTWLRSLEAADVVIAGSDILADAASEHTRNVHVIPSCIEPGEYRVKTTFTIGSAPRAVWIGSPATEGFLRDIGDALLSLHASHGLRLTVISGGDADLGPLTPMIDRRPWSRAGFAADIAAGDFGLMPLPDTPYTRGKCSYKLLQYAATGLPLVGTPVGANEAVLSLLGGLPATTTAEWIAAMTHVIELTEADRGALGERMRTGVVAEFSYARWAPDWLRLLDLDTRH